MADSPSQPPPLRRWFQFRLRTFLTGITVAAVWCGGQANIMTDRKAMLDLIAACGGWHHTDMAGMRGDYRPGLASRLRALFGDVPIPVIVLPDSMKSRRAEIHDAIPEAILIGEANGRFCAPPPER